MAKLIFPQDFLWGSSTAAHQVEGNNTNSDWWEWEHSELRAAELQKQNKNPQDFYSGIACDSYNRYEEDFDIAVQLHQNAHRLSIEWARIEPFQGEFDLEPIKHYCGVLKALKRRGIKTFVTLHHFTSPVWFKDRGGWAKQENVAFFVRYAEKVISELGQYIDFVCVINEPNVYAFHGYITGWWPPNRSGETLVADAVLKNFAIAHRKAYAAIKSARPEIQVGSATAVWPAYPIGVLRPLRKIMNWLGYGTFYNAVHKHSDFIGVQYYSRKRLRFSWKYPFTKEYPPQFQTNDFGWEIFPQGLYDVLVELESYGKPIYITENGIADATDAKRKGYIASHLTAVHNAIKAGADIRGYLHWSLLDNFEWAVAYSMKFGLVEIDRQHDLKRIVRESAKFYAEVCRTNTLELPGVASASPPAAEVGQ